MFKNSLFLLFAIIGLGFFLRMYQVASLPVILNRDEAALAYNAYLLKETGKDEWNRAWPIMLESFGDFKLPGYPLILIGFYQLFGLSDSIVRLPSVLAGTGLIVLAYWWARKLKFNSSWSLLTALIVALTPVFWFYSRIAFEANLALSLFVWATGLLIFYQNKKTDILALILIILACLTYNTPLLLIPFLIVIIPLIRGVKKWRSWILPVVGLTLIFIAIFSVLFPLTSQKKGITIFSDETIWIESVAYRDQFSGLAQTILGNKYIFFLQLIAIRFIRSFSPTFMVISGGTHPWHSIPNGGHIIWLVYLSGLGGIILSIKQLFAQKKLILTPALILLFLLVIGLAPSVITVDAPHATRSLFFFFIFSLLAVSGMIAFSKMFGQKKLYIQTGLLIVVIIGGLNFLQNYFIRFALDQPTSIYPGFDLAIQTVATDYQNQQVAIVDSEGYHYILAAWYLKTDPAVFQNSIVKQLPNQIGFRYGERFDKFHFIGANEDAQIEGEQVILYWDGTEWRIINL